MLGKYWAPRREPLVTYIEISSIREALKRGYSVVVDATNIKNKYVNNFRKIAEEHKVKVEIKSFLNVSVRTCMQRDQQRENPVGREVIERMYDTFLREQGTVK